MKLAIIPARGGSKRIKNKNILEFGGKPMIAHSLSSAKGSLLFDKIHVSTDSNEIKSVVEELGFGVDFLRDSSLADDHTPIFPVVKWVLETYKERGEIYDEICILFPTAPLIDSMDLQSAYKIFQENKCANVTMSCGKFNVPIQWALEKSNSGLLSPREPEMLVKRSQDLPEYYYDSGLFYFLKPEHLDRPIGENYLAFEVEQQKCVDIDSEEDLKFAKALFDIKKGE